MPHFKNASPLPLDPPSPVEDLPTLSHTPLLSLLPSFSPARYLDAVFVAEEALGGAWVPGLDAFRSAAGLRLHKAAAAGVAKARYIDYTEWRLGLARPYMGAE